MELPISVPMLRRIKAVEAVLLAEHNPEEQTPHPEPMSDSSPVDALHRVESKASNASMHTEEATHKVVGGGTDAPSPVDRPAADISGNNNSEKNNSKMAGGSRRSNSPEPMGDTEKKQPVAANANMNEVLGVHPLRVNEEEAEKLLQWYKGRVSDKFTQSFCPFSALVNKSQTGYEPCWLCLAAQDYPKEGVGSALKAGRPLDPLVKGLAVFFTDPASQTRSRVSILHVSVLDQDQDEKRLPDFVRLLVDYIWKTAGCEEVRVELAHFPQDGKLAPYEPLKLALHALKFRWKTLVSDQQGNRAVVLGLARPKETPFENPRGVITGKEPITFKHGVALAVAKTEVPTKERMTDSTKEERGGQIFTQCSWLEAIREYGRTVGQSKVEIGTSEETKDLFVQSLVGSLGKVSTLSANLACKAGCGEEMGKVMELFASQKLPVPAGGLPSAESIYAGGVQSLVLKWASYDYTVSEGVGYVRVKGNFVVSDTEKLFLCLIRSDDEAIGIAIAVPRTTSETFWSGIRETIAGMKKEDTRELREVWVPGFDVDTTNSPAVQQLSGCTLSGRSILAGIDVGHCSVYAPAPQEGSLLPGDMGKVYVVKDDFYFAGNPDGVVLRPERMLVSLLRVLISEKKNIVRNLPELMI